MDHELILTDVVQREVERYGEIDSLFAHAFTIADPIRHLYAVIIVPDREHPHPFPARADVMAQIVDDTVVILEDRTDKPLYQALIINGGVPREKIILAYAGESLPNTDAPTE